LKGLAFHVAPRPLLSEVVRERHALF